MTMAHTAKGFKRNARWVVAGTSATLLSQVVTIVVLARLLNPLEFGIVSVATLVNQFALIFAEFGVATFIVQRATLNDKLIGTAYVVSCSLGLAVAAIILAIAPLIADMMDSPDLTKVLQTYSVMFLLFGASTVHDALAQRDLDYSYLARSDAVSYSLGYAGISICCAWLGFSYWSLVIGHISQQAIRCFFLRARSRALSKFPANWEDIRYICQFGLGQTLSRMGSFLAGQADGFVVSKQLGLVEMGNYGRANQLATMPAAQLGQIFDKLIFPYISRMQDERERTSRAYLLAVTGISIISLPACAIIWTCGDSIVNVLLGAQWGSVVAPLKILGLAIPFRLIHKVSDPTARAMGKTYSRAWRQWLVGGCLLGFSLFLSRYGLAAITWGVVATAAIDATLMVWLCFKVTKFHLPALRHALTPGLSAGLLALILTEATAYFIALNRLSDFYLLILAGLFYLAIVKVFLRNFIKAMR